MTKPKEKGRRELPARINKNEKKIRQHHYKEKIINQKLSGEEQREQNRTICDKIIYVLKLAFCGNDCNRCKRYIATQNGLEPLKQVAILWKRLSYRDIIEPPEKMACYGCSSAVGCRYGIKECALENKVDNCGLCSRYPCNKIENMFQWAFQHAERMKDQCSEEEYNLC
jgi:hypothetical protein